MIHKHLDNKVEITTEVINTAKQEYTESTCGDLSLIELQKIITEELSVSTNELHKCNNPEFNKYYHNPAKKNLYFVKKGFFISKKLQAQLEYANQTGVIFDSLQRAINSNYVEVIALDAELERQIENREDLLDTEIQETNIENIKLDYIPTISIDNTSELIRSDNIEPTGTIFSIFDNSIL